MALDKLVDSTQLDADLTSVANAIRTKGGTSASLAFPADFVSAIAAIPSGGGFNYKTGTFTLASDTSSMATAGNGIAHGLGTAPKVVIVWQETYDDNNIPTVQVNAGYVYLDRIMEMAQRLSSTQSSAYGFYAFFNIAANANVMAFSSPTSTSYLPAATNKPTSTEFYLYYTGGSNRWRAGVDYHYFVSEAWW